MEKENDRIGQPWEGITKFQLALLYNSLPGGMLGGYFAPNLPFYFINERMLDYLGYETEEEFLKRVDGNLINCIETKDRDRVINEVTAQIQSGQPEYECVYRLTKKDSSYFWVMAKGRIFYLKDDVPVLFSICMDITEQKDLEKQLALYRKASRGGAFTIMTDNDLSLIYANDIFYQVHGYTKDSFLEKLDNKCAKLIHPEDFEKLYQTIQEALEAGQESLEWEMRIVSCSGKIRWIQARGAFEWRDGSQIMNGFVIDITQQHELKESIKTSEERYRIAIAKANISLWEYNIQENVLSLIQGTKFNRNIPDHIKCDPDEMIAAGIIHPDSREDMKQLLAAMQRGDKQAFADIKSNTQDGMHWWERLTFTMIYDEAGTPLRAVAVGENITEQKEAEIHYQRELQLRDTISPGFIAGSRANLDKNLVEMMQVPGADYLEPEQEISYDEMAEIGANSMINAEDKERYYATFSREALLEAYRRGKTLVSMDYRRKSKEGKMSWVNATSRLVKDALSGSIYSYSSIRDVSGQKVIEQALQQKAERDSLTDAYNKETALGMMHEAILLAQKSHKEYVLLIFNVDNFSKLIQTCGYQMADQVMKDISTLLKEHFEDPKIIGRMFGDEMAVWVCNYKSQEQIFCAADQIRKKAADMILLPGKDFCITISVGMTFSAGRKPGKEELFDRAWAALGMSREKGGDCCSIDLNHWASEKGNTKYASNKIKGMSMRAASVSEDADKKWNSIEIKENIELTEASKERLLKMEEIQTEIEHLMSDQLWEFVKSVIHFYRVDTITYLPVMEGQPEYLLLSDHKQVLLQDPKEIRELFPEENASNIYLGRIDTEGVLAGAVRMVNLKKNSDQLELVHALEQLLISGISQIELKKKEEYQEHHDILSGALNRKAYLAYMESIIPDTLLSLGVLSVDINGLKQINTRYGHAYGDKMVCFVAASMQEILDNNKVFRLTGDEFVAVCENLTSQAFQNKITQLKQKVQQKYKQGISIGDVWADKEINPDELILQADERMMIAKQAHYKESGILTKYHNPASEAKLLKDIAEGGYEMFLQPKANILDKSIAGAEALVRFRDKEGNLVFPDRFIPQLEQEGNIHFIDFFIFEEVCRTLGDWQRQGLELIPISLNFSRSTMLQDNLIDQMEKIYAKHPVLKKYIEIEITESIGSIEQETLIRISGEIVKNNYRLALDDFGARYSNLAILSSMKLNVLKLDKSLVYDLFTNPNTRIVVKNFLQACRELDISSVAEGVETKEQLGILKTLGCDYAQGYLFNKPIPRKEFEKMYLRSNV